MRKRVISWLLTVVMVVSLLPTSVLADTLAADQEQQTQQEQTAPADTDSNVPTEDEETQEQQEPAEEVPVSRSARSGGAAPMLAAAGAVQDIGTAEDFAAMQPSGNYQLTADITVTAPYANDFTDFSGTFDGNGHTVTLDITASTANVGLFSKLAGGAVVKNVKVDGTVSGTEGVAGIAAQANGATISGCINCAEISATERHVGGIVGKLRGGTVENCYNTGAISSSRTRPINMGGIAGYVDGGASVENCYNTGSITGSGDNTAADVGWNAATVKNCYYLESTYKVGSCGNGDYTDPTVSKTDAEMRSGDIITLLGSAFMAKAGDYPALSWETPTAAVLFAIAPANATLEINGGTYTGSTTVALPAADTPYSYTVSCDGYTTKTGTVTVTNKDNPVADPANVTVTLAEDTSAWVNVTFNVTPTGAALTVKRGDTEIEPQSDGSYKLLKDHTYTYTAETAEEGYEPAAGEVTPDESSTQTVALKKVQSIAVTKAPTKTEYYKGDAELDLTGMVLTVKYEGTDETRTIEGDYAAAGVTYEGFSTEKPIESQTVTVKYRGKTATFTIKVKDAMLFADFFTGLNGIATAQNSTSYKFEPVLLDGGYVLKSTNEKKGNTTSSLTLTFAKAAQLTFDCKTDSEKNYDGLRVDINNQQGNQFGSTGGGYSGEKQDWKEFSIAVNAGDKVTVNYRKDSSGDKGQDCIWLRNFRAEVLPTVRFDVKDAAGTAIDATVTLKKGYTGLTAGTDGSYALTVGEKYTYTVEKKGYEKVTQEFTAQEGNNTITVTLVKLPVITLKFTPDDAAVTLKQGNTTVYKESADSEKGKNVYIAAKNTDYTYTVSKFGYETATGTISVATTDVNKTVKLTELAKQTVTFNITKPEGVNAEPTITVKSGSITAYTGSGANCTLPAGDYTYTAKLDGCDTLSGSFVVKAAKTIGLEFVKSLTFNDFFAGLDGITAENGTRYGFEPVRAAGGNYLESNRRSYGATSLTLTATESRLVSFRYLAKGNKAEYSWEDDSAFTVKKGTTLLTAYEENGWKTFSTVLNKDEKLTLSFSESGSSYYVRLKDFAAAAAHTLTLKTPDGATVVLKDRSGAEITGKNGAYTVAAGTYAYTVSKFGYETKTGNITVSADVNETVTLSELASCTLTFAVTPAENAKVTVTHPVGGTIKPEANGGYKLYLGETYAYTVTKADYVPVHGSITAAEDKTLSFTLTYAGEGWDGTAKTAPTQDKNGVYQIGTAAKLAWFADAVNKGDTTISGKLTANINLNDKAWTAIGTDSNKFAGTLDGDNYTVSGLAGTGGLVYYLSANGTVKSLCVDCAIDGTSNVGGIADKSEGRIENCLVSGYIKGGDDVIFGVGGIVGHGVAGNVISGCVSTADILFKYSRYAVQNGAGGIVGYTYGTVENCYFAGNVHTNAKSVSAGGFGGLVGCARSNAVMKDCYTVGAVTGPESSFGAVVGKVNSGATITNCAYLDTVAPQAVAEGSTSGMTARTADYMRTPEFAAEMGMHLDSGNSNGGFPVLPWQGGTPVDNADLKAAAAAANALELRGMSAADAAKKAKADWYAKIVLEPYDLNNYNDKADLCEQYGIEAPGEAVTDLHDYFLTALQKHFYKEQGLDAENADLLKADATGVYQLRGLTPVSGDPEEEEETAQTYTGFLTLPASVTVPVEGSGEKIVSLTWTADNALVNTATGALTAPAADKVTVTLTATLQSGAATKVKTFTLCLWSENAEKVQTLEDIAAEFTRKNTAVQPLQGVGLYDETNITQAFRRLLAEQGYADVADKAEITYVNGSAKANGFDGTKVQYIADNGDIEYFTGDGTARQTVQYTGLKFNITYAGVTKEITLRATVGRSADAVQKLLESAAGSLNWELIRGENTNGATQSEVAGWTLYTVNDRITSNLTLPSGIAGRYDVKVQWGTRNTEWLYCPVNICTTRKMP